MRRSLASTGRLDRGGCLLEERATAHAARSTLSKLYRPPLACPEASVLVTLKFWVRSEAVAFRECVA